MKENVIKKNTLLLGLIGFLTEFKLYAAVLALYFSEVTGSMALGMSVFSVSMLATTVLELPSGLASDTMGRKQTLIWGVISSLAYTVCYAIGQNIAVFIWELCSKVSQLLFLAAITMLCCMIF